MSAAVALERGPVEEFREWLVSQGLSTNTIVQRTGFAAARLAEWGTWDVPPTQVASWLTSYDGWSRRTYTAHLRSLYSFLVEQGALAVDPTARIRSVPSPRPRPRPLSSDELARVLGAADGDLLTWLLLGSKGGLRLHEIAKVRGEDVDGRWITIAGKGGVTDRVPLHQALRERVDLYPASGWWFPSTYSGYGGDHGHISAKWVGRCITDHFRAHGLTGGTHRLRHTYGTMLAKGTPLHVVQKLMRHSSLATTELYLGVDHGDRMDAIDGLE
ncbi:MAG: tyrosine-type recombinase/integrase [Propionibacteriales bacterium]|nr:tyrosine-type recombinase/integrase [Propionibacteriales bacterium]